MGKGKSEMGRTFTPGRVRRADTAAARACGHEIRWLMSGMQLGRRPRPEAEGAEAYRAMTHAAMDEVGLELVRRAREIAERIADARGFDAYDLARALDRLEEWEGDAARALRDGGDADALRERGKEIADEISECAYDLM